MDIVTTLRSEHDKVINLFNQFQKDTTQEAQRQLMLQLLQELSVHEAAEESAVWPEVRQVVDAKLINEALKEETELKQVLRRFNGKLDQQTDLTGVIDEIRQLVMHHVSTEQDQIFPVVTQKCDAATRDRLGTAYLDAKHALIDRAATLNVTMLPETPVEQTPRK